MPAESFAILIVEQGQAKLSRFSLELRGETLWARSPEALRQQLARLRPELVAVAGTPETAIELADDLRRRGLAKSVFLITPTADGEISGPGQIPVVLPKRWEEFLPEDLLHSLMQAILEAQARNPVSPLTGLPGSPVLRHEVERRLAAGEPFIFLYMDLNNFKAYNDVFGFGRGDIAIRLLSREVIEATRTYGTQQDLCVHIGGDDFAAVTNSPHYANLARQIIAGFDHQAPSLYPSEVVARGYIETSSRRGEPTRYPLMTVAIGGVNTVLRKFTGYLHLTEVAAEVKSYAKALEGSQFVMDRRRDQD